MDLFTLLLITVMAGLALTGTGLLTAMVILERPAGELAPANGRHLPPRGTRSRRGR
jgi:hypothetical protein